MQQTMRRTQFLLLLVLAPTLAVAAPDFARDVRPILERSCFSCHGPEKQKKLGAPHGLLHFEPAYFFCKNNFRKYRPRPEQQWLI